MEWVGVAVAVVGAVLLYSAVHNLKPWDEFTKALTTGHLAGGQVTSA